MDLDYRDFNIVSTNSSPTIPFSSKIFVHIFFIISSLDLFSKIILVQKLNLNMIWNCYLYNNMYKIDFTENIKKYNFDVPFNLIIYNESIDTHSSLELEIMNLGNIKKKILSKYIGN